MRVIFLSLSLCCFFAVSAQHISGTVFNSSGDLLPFSSISIKGTTRGTSANDHGRFSIAVQSGTYTIVCRHLDYTTAEKTVTVSNDVEVSFVLTEQKLTLEPVVVQRSGEDPAYAIIRHAIAKRRFYENSVHGFSCDVYGKDLISLRSLPKKLFGQKIPDADRKDMGLDSTGGGIIYLSESVSKLSVQQPDKYKLEVVSSRVSGSDAFGFSFPVFIDLYTNNVKVFTEKFNPRGFISPIADGATGFYRFKLLGSFYEDGRLINSIRVTPRRLYEPLFTGTINIAEDEWSIFSFDLFLTKKAQLEIMDTLQVTQLQIPVDKGLQRVRNQVLHFNFNQFGIDAIGNFLTVYSDYKINPIFPKRFFDNVVIKYDSNVNRKTSAYWDSTRAVPLERAEQMDYAKKDSAFKAERDSSGSKHVRDSLNRRHDKLSLLDPFTKGIDRTHFTAHRTISYGIEPLLFNTAYNPAEGIAVDFRPFISDFKRGSRTGLRLETDLRYAFHIQHFDPSASLIFNSRTEDSAKKLKRFSLSFSGGKRVSGFNKDGQITPFKNTVSTLFYGRNYLKTYENYFARAAYSKRYESGFRFAAELLYEDRLPLDVRTRYTFFGKDSAKITPNYPYEKIAAQFPRHQAVIASASISFKPGQRYIELPNSKVPLGSRYPTFTLVYAKGLKNILGSDVSFDKWQAGVFDDKNLKLAGTLRYRFSVGGFLSRQSVFIQDYQHFNGNQTAAAGEYLNTFQLAPYYAYSTVASLFETAHLEQHLNGLLTNKIPLFRKLDWNLVVGTNAFYVNRDNHYFEVFAGLENILKVFRLDAVLGFTPDHQHLTGLRLGAGGLLGSSLHRNGRNSMEVRL